MAAVPNRPPRHGKSPRSRRRLRESSLTSVAEAGAWVAARLISPTGKRQTLAPVQPNVGVRASYERRLDALIEEMNTSILHWLQAAYRQNEPATLAQDQSAADVLNEVMKRLARRWLRRFDVEAPKIAAAFTYGATAAAQASMKAGLKKAGFTVEFRPTKGQIDAVKAVLAENVGLIRSIPQEYLTQVQGILMRSVSAGRDLQVMASEIKAQYGVTKRRAALIARDQNNKATAVIIKTRQQELGITQAEWRHSNGGRVPRPSHVKAGRERLVYNVAEGALIDGKRIWPGTEINCRCVARSIIPGIERHAHRGL